MAVGSMSLRSFLLGLLNQKPMSGYDIKQSLRNFDWLIGSPSPGSLYPALRGLLQDGLVTVDVVVRQDRPPRKEYHISPAGQEVLRQWISQPVSAGTLKTFAMRLILSGNLSPSVLLADLQRRLSAVSRYLALLEQTLTELDQEEDAGQRLAVDYGLAVARSELAWLENTVDRLRGGALSGHLVSRDAMPTTHGEDVE
jgi:DNA-binding PadR family transcriptional regulator